MGRWSSRSLWLPPRGSAWRQSAPVTAKAAADASVARAEGRRSSAAQRGALAKTYEDQLEAVDRLKKQKRVVAPRSRAARQPRRRRTTPRTSSCGHDTQLAKAHTALAASRRTLIAAIDAELATAPAAPRARRARAHEERSSRRRSPRRSSPHRAARRSRSIRSRIPRSSSSRPRRSRDTEAELRARSWASRSRPTELDEVAKLRKAHDRATDLAKRDDDQPQRTAQSGGSRGGLGDDNASPAPEVAGGSGGGGGTRAPRRVVRRASPASSPMRAWCCRASSTRRRSIR